MNGSPSIAQREEANAILAGADQATDRGIVAWAMGVRLDQHCVSLLGPLAGEKLEPNGDSGGSTVSLLPHRTLDYHHIKGAWLREQDTRIVTMSWAEIGALLRRDRVSDRLVDRAWEVTRERLAWDHQVEVHHWPLADRLARTDAWNAIERRCYAVGAAIWDACRPTERQPEQLDLFALLEAAA